MIHTIIRFFIKSLIKPFKSLFLSHSTYLSFSDLITRDGTNNVLCTSLLRLYFRFYKNLAVLQIYIFWVTVKIKFSKNRIIAQYEKLRMSQMDYLDTSVYLSYHTVIRQENDNCRKYKAWIYNSRKITTASDRALSWILITEKGCFQIFKNPQVFILRPA